MENKTLTLFFLVSLSLAAIPLAQSGGKFDFGTMQEGSSFNAEPGDTVNLSVFFFIDQEYGNRITHIRLSAIAKPEGWEVAFSPAVHEEQLNVSGVLVTSRENLFVEPKPVLPAKPSPEDAEPGTYYLATPSGKGYLQAKRIVATVKIPKTAELGKTYEVKLLGEAFWFGQTGNVALQQTRAFPYSITMVKREYTEQVVKPAEQQGGIAIDTNMLIIGALVLVILLMAAYMLLGKRGRGGQAISATQKPSQKK